MNWKELIAEVTAVGAGGGSGEPVTGVEYDSRKVRPGAVFVAMKGGSTDGNRYVEKAVAAGALGNHHRLGADFRPSAGLSTPACRCWRSSTDGGRWRRLRRPSSAIRNAGLRLRESPGRMARRRPRSCRGAAECGFAARRVLVGTIEYHVAGEVRPSVHTTPESRDLYELMAEGVSRGATELVTEVSSHALDQGRAAGVNFDVAVFTNLTRDHLDYHGTMEKYFAAKRLLFDGTVYPAPRVAVLNAHDPHSAATGRGCAAGRGRGADLWDWRGRLARGQLHAHAQRRGAGTGNPGGRG